jgi:hypothetical protein
MREAALEQLSPTADPRYLCGRCPICQTWRIIPATAPPRCWVCAQEARPELPPAP